MSDSFIVEAYKKLGRHFFSSLRFIPDEPYLKWYYRVRTGKKLDLNNPVGFNEKLNWLKIHDRNPEYTKMADKLLVRDIVRKKIGDGYSIPLLGHWNSFDEIDFDSLPNAFVLKCNHDSGSVRIVKDKQNLKEKEINALKKHFDKCISGNPGWMAREFAYMDIQPCIIAEQYMGNGELNDYKFYCFNGVPYLMFIVSGRYSAQKHEDYFDMNGNPVDVMNGVPHSDTPPELPTHFEEMKQIAAKLSEGLRVVRLDLYEQNGKIYFGEYTFYPAGGTLLFKPDEWEKRLGKLITIKNEQ